MAKCQQRTAGDLLELRWKLAHVDLRFWRKKAVCGEVQVIFSNKSSRQGSTRRRRR